MERYFSERKKVEEHDLGVHGYDNNIPSMHAMFFGHGPAFKRGFSGKPFQNIEINYLLQGRFI